MKVSSETRLDDLVEHHPAARVVLSRYRLGSYEESEPPRESVAWFAEDRGIPAGRLVEKLGRVAAISRQEPPPSSFLSLLETHQWLDEHFLLHQEALLAGDLPLALDILKTVEESQREHIRIEEELLLPVYERAGRIPGGATPGFT